VPGSLIRTSELFSGAGQPGRGRVFTQGVPDVPVLVA